MPVGLSLLQAYRCACNLQAVIMLARGTCRCRLREIISSDCGFVNLHIYILSVKKMGGGGGGEGG